MPVASSELAVSLVSPVSLAAAVEQLTPLHRQRLSSSLLLPGFSFFFLLFVPLSFSFFFSLLLHLSAGDSETKDEREGQVLSYRCGGFVGDFAAGTAQFAE